jgi:hypothetical protein
MQKRKLVRCVLNLRKVNGPYSRLPTDDWINSLTLESPGQSDRRGSIVKLTVPIVSNSPAAATAIANCSAANTFVWAAFDGAGTAGTAYYVVEFSNIGSKACTLHGNASVWAISKTGLQLGKPASHQGVPSTVTLAHDGTAHAILGIVDTGAACPGQGVRATALRVVPPGQTLASPAGERDEVPYFPVQVCAHQSSMHVLPVRSGTGIPLYTTS